VLPEAARQGGESKSTGPVSIGARSNLGSRGIEKLLSNRTLGAPGGPKLALK